MRLKANKSVRPMMSNKAPHPLMTDRQDKACQACEFYKAYWFTHAVKAGIDTDIAREMAQAISTAWRAGYNYAKGETHEEGI